jgi:hypothetical protein
MPSIYRMPAGRPPPCRDHPKREGAERCVVCRAFLCDACTTEGASGATCLVCAARAARAARRRRPVLVALLTSVASVAFVFAYFHLATLEPEPAPSIRAVLTKEALRQCREDSALILLLDMHAAGEDRALLSFARELDEACGERPMVLAMAYRGACGSGDTRAADAIAERLAALPAEAAPSWRCLPCGDRPRVCGAETPSRVAKAPPR